MMRGEKVCAFIEAYCKIPEGAHVAQPIKLMKFQKQIIRSAHDQCHRQSGERGQSSIEGCWCGLADRPAY